MNMGKPARRASLWVPSSRKTKAIEPPKEVDNSGLIAYLSEIETVGKATALLFIELGLDTYEKVATCDINVLIEQKGISEASAATIQESAKTLLGEQDERKIEGDGQPHSETEPDAEADNGGAENNPEDIGTEDPEGSES